MPTFPAEVLISRHIEKLSTRPDKERVDVLLDRCRLSREGGSVTSREKIDFETCYRYKQCVKEVYGDAAYSFAKVNFVLGGCRCKDCAG